MTSSPVPTQRPSGAAPRSRRWVAIPFRVVVAVHVLLVFTQAALAGSSLVGDAAALRLHEINGTGVLMPVTLVLFVLAMLVWRPGRGPAWPVLATVLLLVAQVLQISYGFAGRLALHVPLGVAIFGLSLALLLGTRTLTRRQEP